jgi:3'-phosphoadenosine 5'-phosphosulfate sulfotransferase (PAPS reductase)/FAD synthetase
VPAIILSFLPYLFQAAKAVPEILTFVKNTRQHLQQTGEWTNEAEATYKQSLADLENDPAWKPESQP